MLGFERARATLFYIQDMNEVLKFFKRSSHVYSSRILFKLFKTNIFCHGISFCYWVWIFSSKNILRSLTDSIINQIDKVKWHLSLYVWYGYGEKSGIWKTCRMLMLNLIMYSSTSTTNNLLTILFSWNINKHNKT